jgi:hypothetical protein
MMSSFTFSNTVTLGDLIGALTLVIALVSVCSGFMMYKRKKQDAHIDALRQSYSKLQGFCNSYNYLIEHELYRLTNEWFWSCMNSDKLKFRFQMIHNQLLKDNPRLEQDSDIVNKAFEHYESTYQLGYNQEANNQIKATINSLIDIRSSILTSNPILGKRVTILINTLKGTFEDICNKWLTKDNIVKQTQIVIKNKNLNNRTFDLDELMVLCLEQYCCYYITNVYKELMYISVEASKVLVGITASYLNLDDKRIIEVSRREQSIAFPRKKYRDNSGIGEEKEYEFLCEHIKSEDKITLKQLDIKQFDIDYHKWFDEKRKEHSNAVIYPTPPHIPSATAPASDNQG